MKKVLFIVFLLFFSFVFSQEKYPKDYFSNPLKIPTYLSGTFAELRGNHFHSGIDIKTQQKEGFEVYASASGYVSRIKISHWGYGKAIYVTHPNGYTTVYAHLKKFSNKIEAYIKKQQYKKESFEIQLFPKKNDLPITKDQVIAFSGATGGFVGPHLHFEIRDTKSEKPINPMYFGIGVKDTQSPIITTLMGYSLNENSHINQIQKPVKLSFKRIKGSTFKADPITAYGKIGFGINTYDLLNGARNRNGVYSVEMRVNGKQEYLFTASSFSFFETKYINLLIDYERYNTLRQRIHKCFVNPASKLSIYQTKNYGMDIKNNLDYSATITVKDFKGNTTQLIIPIKGKKETILAEKETIITPYKIERDKFAKFTKNGVTIAFPKNTFYENTTYLNFKVDSGIAKVHKPVIPLNRKFTLTFDVSKYNEKEKKYLYIARLRKNRNSYVKTVKKQNTFYTTTKNLGSYKLMKDSIKPTVTLLSFKNNQWITNHNTIRVKIKDTGSGIKSYRGEIDGKWILMEYNVKNEVLTYDLSDKKFTTAKHQLKVTVKDNVGNTTILNRTFFRKK